MAKIFISTQFVSMKQLLIIFIVWFFSKIQKFNHLIFVQLAINFLHYLLMYPLVLNLESYCASKCSTKEAALRMEPHSFQYSNIFTRKNEKCYVYLHITYIWSSLSKGHQTVKIMDYCVTIWWFLEIADLYSIVS